MNENNYFDTTDEKELIDNAVFPNGGRSDTRMTKMLVNNSSEDISGPIKKRRRPMRNW